MSDAPGVLTLGLSSGDSLSLTRVPDEAFTSLPMKSTLAVDEGLAYVLMPARRVGFWTLGFETAIDQVFVARTGRVVQVIEARAAGEGELAGPTTDVSLVLELAAGAARRLGILPGAILSARDEVDLFDASADPGFIVIVQSDRAGWFLACEFRRRGYRIAHVHHTQHLDEVGEDQFDVELVYDDDLDEVLPTLTTLGPSLVLAGSELGVNPADYLSEALGLPTNGTLRSVARRDKAGMVDALRARGIPVMRQLRSRSWKRILRWMERHQLREIVIKPVRSAGTDRVSRARNADEVERAVRAIIGVTNRLGLREVEVVAQERLFGPEIYLNTVSRAGRHAITEIWLETKRAGRDGGAPDTSLAPFAYDTFQLLPGDDVLAGYLRTWLVRVLDALGLAWGPAHTELILTAEGPRLIDFGARLDGVLLPSLNEECIGKSPVQITADAYLDPAAWEAWAATPYRLLQRATMVVIDNPCAGILRNDSGLRNIAWLPTFHALRPRWGVGETVPATRDAFSYHAIITLRDPDLAAVERDHALIRALEAADLLLDVTAAASPATAPGAPLQAHSPYRLRPPLPNSDPRVLAGWGRALSAFGWTTIGDPQTGLVGYLRDELDGPLLWLPRQAKTLPLIALERLRCATLARRIIVELHPDTRVIPLVGADVVVSQSWDSEIEAALDVIGLTPTMHAQAPAMLEYALAEVGDPEVVVTSFSGSAADHAVVVESAFRAVGAGASARWPAALAANLIGDVPCALAIVRADAAIVGAAFGLVHGGVLHVPVASAFEADDLRRLALTLGATFGLPVIAPGTGVSRAPGGVMVALPPALRWKRPDWAQHLSDVEGLRDAAGLPIESRSAPLEADVAARFATREHPLATWGGATLGQALGRAPVWARTAMLYREAPGEAPHGVVPHARRIDLAALEAVADKLGLLWVGWEPPPTGGEIIANDGHIHRIDWSDPARALHDAAGLGLYPVRARWTHRKTHVLDLHDDLPSDSDQRVCVVPAAALGASEWRRIEALDNAHTPTQTMFAHARTAARGLVLGMGRDVVCVLAEGADGLDGYALSLLHDRVAWCLFGNVRVDGSVSPTTIGNLLRSCLMRHARIAGCDLIDMHGTWDPRFPEERQSWRDLPGDPDAHPVLYPPTLARFRS